VGLLILRQQSRRVPHFWATLPEVGILTFGTVGQSMLALPGKFERIKHGNMKPTEVSLVPGSQMQPLKLCGRRNHRILDQMGIRRLQ
jgi:hypothetical protein